MALRLRRGLDSDRQLLTPAAGELIYTTDKNEIWVGDGSTAGGRRVTGIIPTSLNDLDEFDIDIDSLLESQVLRWNGAQFEAGNIINDGDQYTIDILGSDGTTIVDSTNSTINAGQLSANSISSNTISATNFIGDGSQLTNLDQALYNNSYRFNLLGEDSSVLVDVDTNTFTGTFVGDGSGLTNVNVSDSIGIFDLNNTYKFSDPDLNDLLIWDGFNFVPDRIRQIIGDDSSIMVNATTQTFTGNFVGDGSGLTNVGSTSVYGLDEVSEVKSPDPGDLLIWDGFNYVPDRIRVLVGDDSTVLLDTATQTFTGNFVGAGEPFVNLKVTDIIAQNGSVTITPLNSPSTRLTLNGNDDDPEIKLTNKTELANSVHGTLKFGKESLVNSVLTYQSSVNIVGSETELILAKATPTYDFPVENFVTLTDSGNLVVGGLSGNEKLSVNGNATVNGFVQFGSFTTTDRNGLTPQNGMVLYNTTDNRFQGYQNGGWVNLDDGTAA